jgi:predicted DNA-binding transcriptional regulator AlpA
LERWSSSKGAKVENEPKHDLPDPSQRAVDSRWVAAFCGVTTHAVRAWRERGEGPPHFKLPNGFVRYRISDVVDWFTEYYRGKR